MIELLRRHVALVGRHSWNEESTRSRHVCLTHLRLALNTHSLHARHILSGEVRLAILLALRKSDVERLDDDNATVHLSDGLGGLFWRTEADETEATRSTVLLLHNL